MAKKKKTIELTERDIELLKELAEHIVISIGNVGKIYQTDRYHELRLKDLSDTKYVKRKDGYVYLGTKGKEYLKSQGIKVPTLTSRKDGFWERTKHISDLYYDFKSSPWVFIDGKEIKKQYKTIDRGSMFLGLITGRTQYMIYFLSKRYDKKQITTLKNEISKLYKYGIYRVVIFYRDKEERERYGSEALGIKEQLALPYPGGLELLKKHGEKDIVKAAAEKVYSELKEASWKEADFEAEGKQIMVLILNDIEKRAKIRNYIEMSRYRYTSRQDIEILCLKEQEETFKKEFPECSIKTISMEEVLEL